MPRNCLERMAPDNSKLFTQQVDRYREASQNRGNESFEFVCRQFDCGAVYQSLA